MMKSTRSIGRNNVGMKLQQDYTLCCGLSPGDKGKLHWTGNWVTFLDTMLQMLVVGLSGRSLRLPTRIRSVCVDPVVHLEKICKYTDEKEGVWDFHVEIVILLLSAQSAIYFFDSILLTYSCSHECLHKPLPWQHCCRRSANKRSARYCGPSSPAAAESPHLGRVCFCSLCRNAVPEGQWETFRPAEHLQRYSLTATRLGFA